MLIYDTKDNLYWFLMGRLVLYDPYIFFILKKLNILFNPFFFSYFLFVQKFPNFFIYIYIYLQLQKLSPPRKVSFPSLKFYIEATR